MWMGKVIFFVLLLFIQAPFTAKVIRILDGDTLEILYKNKPVKIRLAHIDCPEKRSSQPFNNNAKKALSDLCFGQQVTIYLKNSDRYGRLIAVVINAKKQVVNQEMIKQGMAWH
jgi:endonuclease YncB( thermonuclease family)